MLQASVKKKTYSCEYEMWNSAEQKDDFDACVHAVVLWVELLTSPAVKSSGKSSADALSGCKTAPYNNTQSIHKHRDQLWIYSVGNYGGDRIIWANSQLCEQGDTAGQ